MNWHSNFKVVSFYTPDYEQHAFRLIKSIKEALPGQAYAVEGIAQRAWAEATNFKPTFIRKHLKDGPVLWVDADATIEGPVTLPHADFAIYARLGDPLRTRFSPFRTGTVYFGDSHAAKLLLASWESHCATREDGIDQWALWDAWLGAQQDRLQMPSTVFLPISYCQKKDEETGVPPLIRHYMASRSLKRSK